MKASQFIQKAESLGHKAEVDGEWIKWTPPLPTEMLLQAVNLSDEIAKEIRGRKQ